MLKLAVILGIAATASAQCGPDELQNVHDACCPSGTSCTDDLPATCSGICSSEFLDFYAACPELISSAGPDTQHEFDNFAQLCRTPRGCSADSDCDSNHGQCVPLMGCTTEPCSSCICEQGYEGDGHVCSPSPPPPAPPAPGNLATATPTPVNIAGRPVDGEITDGADIYSFTATSGNVYQIIVELGTCTDTVVEIWASDRSTYVDSNDDSNGGLGSELDWSAQQSGTYFIAVRGYADRNTGTYTLSVLEQGAGGGACGTDQNGQPNSLTLRDGSGQIDFTDDTYQDGQSCQWLINCPGRGADASLRFSSFATETNYDFVDIYDGRTSTADSLAHISGSMDDGTGGWADGANPQAVTNYHASTDKMLVVFTSDQSVRGGGFTFTYECGSSPPSPPGPSPATPIRLNVGTAGTIQTEGSYAVYTFTAQPNTDYILETQLTGANPMEDSVIEVYSSPDMTQDPVAMNDDGPENLDGPHNTASYLEFSPEVSTATTYYVGVRGYSPDQTGDFVLTVSAGSETACTAQGQSVNAASAGSISFTDGYQNSADCKWTLSCPNNNHVTVIFREFDTESNFDFVKLYDGSTASSTNLASLSGNSMPDPDNYQSTGSTMLVEFTADQSVLGGGFEFEYGCQTTGPPPNVAPTQSTCTSVRIGSDRPTAGEITAAAPVQYFCLQATAGTTYDITVELGSLSDSIVDIYASNYATWPADPLEHNDDDPNGGLASHVQFTPTSGGVYYLAVSGFSTNLGDFNVVVISQEVDEGPCAGGVTLGRSGGTVQFSSATCDNGCSCDWTVPCARGTHPSVSFDEFNTEAHWDYVKLYNGGQATANQVANFTGTMDGGSQGAPTSGMSYTGTRSRMLVEFTSDASVSSNNAFQFTYTCTSATDAPDCTPGGGISANSPVNGQVGTGPVCYTFQATAGTDYEFTVTLGTLTDSTLSIKDSTGNQVAFNDDAGGGDLASYLVWHADSTGAYTVEVAGFGSSTGTYTVAVSLPGDPCTDGIDLPGDGGSVTYLPDSGTTENNLDCQWHMSCSGSNDVVHLTFANLETEGGWDFVDLYDGSTVDTSDVAIAHLSGDIANLDPLTYDSHSPQMTIHFTTDGSVGAGGFDADYYCGPAEDGPGPSCVDHIEELSGPGACASYLANGYTCDGSFCETCNFSHMCDRSCGVCGR